MGVLSETRDRLMTLCRDAGIDLATPVTVKWATREEGPVRRGREHRVEAALGDAVGEAWTDSPSDWTGTLGDVFGLPLKSAPKRAIVVATLNALASRLGLIGHYLRCRHGVPIDCGRELVAQLRRRFDEAGQIGRAHV